MSKIVRMKTGFPNIHASLPALPAARSGPNSQRDIQNNHHAPHKSANVLTSIRTRASRSISMDAAPNGYDAEKEENRGAKKAFQPGLGRAQERTDFIGAGGSIHPLSIA